MKLRAFTLLVWAGAALADPVADFEQIAKEARKASPGELRITGVTRSRAELLPDIRYDVRKTDSLVTPYTAWVSFAVRDRISVHRTTLDAQTGKEPVNELDALVYRYRLEYGYQKGQWRLTGGRCGLDVVVGGDLPRDPIDPATGACLKNGDAGALAKAWFR